MNRAERRKRAKIDKTIDNKRERATKWIKSLPPDKCEIIKSYAAMLAEEVNRRNIDSLDRCYMAAIIEKTDLSLDEVLEILYSFSDLIEDDAKSMYELKEKCGGDIEMAIKKVNSLEKEVKETAIELINKGLKDKEIREILLAEYPALSKAMVANALKRVKNEIVKEKEAEKKLLEILDLKDNIEKLKNEDTDYEEEVEIKVEELDKEIEKTITVESKKEEIKRPQAKFEFEILNEVRIMDIKGKYATYHIEKNTVEVDGILSFMDSHQVQEWAGDERAELLRKLEELNNKEAELIKVFERFI